MRSAQPTTAEDKAKAENRKVLNTKMASLSEQLLLRRTQWYEAEGEGTYKGNLASRIIDSIEKLTVKDEHVDLFIKLINSFSKFIDQPVLTDYSIFYDYYTAYTALNRPYLGHAGRYNDLIRCLIDEILSSKIKLLNSKSTFKCDDPSLNMLVYSYEDQRSEVRTIINDPREAVALLVRVGRESLSHDMVVVIKLIEAVDAALNILDKPLDRKNLLALNNSIRDLPKEKEEEDKSHRQIESTAQALYYARIGLVVLAEKPTRDYLDQQYNYLDNLTRSTRYSGYYHALTQKFGTAPMLLAEHNWERVCDVHESRLLVGSLIDILCNAIRETNAENIKKLFDAANFDEQTHHFVSHLRLTTANIAEDLLNKYLDDQFAKLQGFIDKIDKEKKPNDLKFYTNALEKAKELRKELKKDEAVNRGELIELARSMHVAVSAIENRTADDIEALKAIATNACEKSSLWKQFGGALLMVLGLITTPALLIGLPIFFKGQETYRHYDRLNTMSDFYTRLGSDCKPADAKEIKQKEKDDRVETKLSL